MDVGLLDMETLLSRMEGDVELIAEVFDVFIDEVPQRHKKFAAALAAGDFRQLANLAHALKGASGTLQAENLRQACSDLERTAREGEEALARALVPRVLGLLDATAECMGEARKTL